ncbi:MAG: (2Fe-2S)-binding protein [Candidatus Aminicenantes bacterium]|nr:(2Fe-2S)-binding protein [Candidatus Aminicenantes bacterium]
MKETISFLVNNQQVTLLTEPDRPLLWVLRNDLRITSPKFGCGEGYCGACTVLIDGESVRSCQTEVGRIKGRRIITLEGLSQGDKLHPIQQAFLKHEAFQCGFCTSGMILEVLALLQKKAQPTRSEIIKALDDHLCRCGAHKRILMAVEEAAALMKGGQR